MMMATVPVPPSTNNLFLSMGRKRVKTPEYRSWLQVAILHFRQLSKPERFPVEVVIQIHGGKRFNTRRDVGNCEKAISDALVEAGVIPDDSISAGLWRIVVEYKPAAKTAEPCAIVSVNPLRFLTMPTTFQIADEECTRQLTKVMEQYHPRLAEADVKVGVLMAFNPEGDAVKHGGYPAFASIRVVALRDRVTKGYDSEMLIDETQWQSMSEAHRAALLDHELSHLSLVPLSAKQLAEARATNSAAPDWKLDDLGRPKLKLVKGDWNAGDGFRDVVARHGKVAIEFANIASAKAMADAAANGEADNGDDIA